MDLSKITNKQLTIIFSVIIVLVITIFVLITINLKQMNECLENPLVYAAEKIYEEHGEMLCSCSILKENYADFTFSRAGIEFKEDEFSSYYKDIDFNNINVIQND